MLEMVLEFQDPLITREKGFVQIPVPCHFLVTDFFTLILYTVLEYQN